MGLLQVLKLPPLPTKVGPPDMDRSAKGAKTATKLSQAATAWRQTHRQASEKITTLKTSIRSHYSSRHPELFQEVERNLSKLDDIFVEVDHRLADSMEAAGKASDDEARSTELANAKRIFKEYVTYIKTQPLVGYLDENPFSKTDLKALLVGGLNEAAKVLG